MNRLTKLILAVCLTFTTLTAVAMDLNTAKSRGFLGEQQNGYLGCLLYTSPSPRDVEESRMPSSA